MNEYNELISKIDKIESELKKRPQEIIDFNSPDWMSFLKTPEILGADLNNQLNDLRTILIKFIVNSDGKTIDLLREKILSSENVLNKIKIPISKISDNNENIQKAFTNALIIEALIGLEPDARDVMLELADLVKFAIRNNLDHKQVFQDVLKYSSESKKNEFGSMKTILMNFING